MSESSEPTLRPVRIVCETGISHDTKVLDPATGRNLLPYTLPCESMAIHVDNRGLVEVAMAIVGIPFDVVADLSEPTLADLARQIADTRNPERSEAALSFLRALSPEIPAGGK